MIFQWQDNAVHQADDIGAATCHNMLQAIHILAEHESFFDFMNPMSLLLSPIRSSAVGLFLHQDSCTLHGL